MTQETGQPEENQIEEAAEKIATPEQPSAAEIADAAKAESQAGKPKQVNFKVKGTFDYEIAYEGDILKITSQNSDEAALIYIFQTKMRIDAAKANMYSKEHKHQYTAIERQDINASLRVLNKLVESIGRRVYQNMMIANMSQEERENWRAANAKAMQEWDEKIKAYEFAKKNFEKSVEDLSLMKNGPERTARYNAVKSEEKKLKQQHRSLFGK